MKSKDYVKATNAVVGNEIARITAEMARHANPVLLIAKCGEPAYVRPYNK